MSDKKIDRGKLFHKLHQLQKIVTRFLKFGKVDEASEIEKREKKILNKIKGRNGKKESGKGNDL
jgi:hypothetical protein